jgi:Fe-S-cluster containining protein
MKFECKQCGRCCKVFADKGVNIQGLPLYEWEKEQLEKIATERGITLKFEPVDLIYDKKSNLYICAQFTLKQEPCPFLIENKCSIYENRPLVCKMYPLGKSPLLQKEQETLNLSAFMHCENFNFKTFMEEVLNCKQGIPSNLLKSSVIKGYYDTFGDCLIYVTINDMITGLFDSAIQTLLEKNAIKLRKVSRLDYSKHKPTPNMEFFVKKGLMDENAKNYLIKDFANYEKVKNIILDKIKQE